MVLAHVDDCLMCLTLTTRAGPTLNPTHPQDLLFLTGTLTVEAIYQDRDQFAQLVREVASPDVGRMGIEILSFTIKVNQILTSQI